jgi:hypothetical protein
MKFPRCEYFRHLDGHLKKLCFGVGNTFDENCKGYRSSCPSYKASRITKKMLELRDKVEKRFAKLDHLYRPKTGKDRR